MSILAGLCRSVIAGGHTTASATPVLVTSTEAGAQDMAAARAAGANYYLIKPLSEQALLDHVALLTGQRR